MTLISAIKKMKEGDGLRRPNWLEVHIIILRYGEFAWNHSGTPVIFVPDFILANDWIIVPEETIKTEIITCGHCSGVGTIEIKKQQCSQYNKSKKLPNSSIVKAKCQKRQGHSDEHLYIEDIFKEELCR